MQIQISWLLQKPTDLDLHCLQRQDLSGFSRTRVNAACKNIADKFSLFIILFIFLRIQLEINSAHNCVVINCTEPLIIFLPSSQYDLSNVVRDVKHQIIISIRTICVNFMTGKVQGNVPISFSRVIPQKCI